MKNLFLAAALVGASIAQPTGEEIFARAAQSNFCQKVKVGCVNSGESKNPVQGYCVSIFGLPAQSTKTYTTTESTTIYTTTKTITNTKYLGSGSASPGTSTSTSTVTAADASTITSTVTNAGGSGGSTAYVFPQSCQVSGPPKSGTSGPSSVQPNKAKRQATTPAAVTTAAASQPACLSKYVSKGLQSSACSCYKLTATTPVSVDTTTTITISTASSTTTETTITGPQVSTTTTTISQITTTTTVGSASATVTGFKLLDNSLGEYAVFSADCMAFTGTEANAGIFGLDDSGQLIGYGGYWPGNPAVEAIDNGESSDFVRFGTSADYDGETMTPLQCVIAGSAGNCQLQCSVGPFTSGYLYNEPGDGRDGSWILDSQAESFDVSMPFPAIMPPN